MLIPTRRWAAPSVRILEHTATNDAIHRETIKFEMIKYETVESKHIFDTNVCPVC